MAYLYGLTNKNVKTNTSSRLQASSKSSNTVLAPATTCSLAKEKAIVCKKRNRIPA